MMKIPKKLSSFAKKLCRQSNSDRPNNYELLAVVEGEKAPRRRRGYVGVYVGKEEQRYEVPVKYLSNPAFQLLLARTEQIRGDVEYRNGGAIKIPCSTAFFDQFLKIAKEF